MYLELKQGMTDAQWEALATLVKRYGMAGSVTWISQEVSRLRKVSSYDNISALGILNYGNVTDSLIQTADSLASNGNEVRILNSAIADGDVEKCIEGGYKLERFTVNSYASMKELDPYVTGVISDIYPYGQALFDKSMPSAQFL
jgi:hypothetical protein